MSAAGGILACGASFAPLAACGSALCRPAIFYIRSVDCPWLTNCRPKALAYIEENKQELVALLKTLCQIPSPSHQEHRRAQFCKDWLEQAGARGVYIDEAQNVVFPLNCEQSNQITLFTAHMDTVFPDLEPLPMEERDGILYCPGAGDDTATWRFC